MFDIHIYRKSLVLIGPAWKSLHTIEKIPNRISKPQQVKLVTIPNA